MYPWVAIGLRLSGDVSLPIAELPNWFGDDAHLPQERLSRRLRGDVGQDSATAYEEVTTAHSAQELRGTLSHARPE